MKNVIKKLLMIAVVCVSMLAAAGVNDAMVAFSTKGQDYYADGTPVMEGEFYALVWMRSGHEFAGIDMNGNAVDAENNAVVVALPLAKANKYGKVRCPLTVFQIEESLAAECADGTYALLLLDTRSPDRSGNLRPSSKLADVKGWGLAAKSRVKAVGSGATFVNTGATAKVATTNASAVPEGEDVPRPKITGIKVQNGYVWLTVTGTSPRMLYNVSAGSTPGKFEKRHAALGAVCGHARRDREITIVTPVTPGQNFFKVIQN